jgi:hypothetical protein
MQARLSMDILNKGDSSRFVRTSRGRFTLRAKVSELSSALLRQGEPTQEPSNSSKLTEYVAEKLT